MDFHQILRAISVGAIPILLAVTLHEVAHGRAARHFGDRTAEAQGRLSLNPLSHVDLFGTILMPAFLFFIGSPFLFGWAKPVPVDARNFRHPRRDMAFVAAAGPGSNLVMAAAWTAIGGLAASGLFGQGALGEWLLNMGVVGLFFNVLLAVFNLVPIPPLDGGRVLVGLLPLGPARAVARLEPFGLWIVIALLLLANRTGLSLAPIVARLSALIARLFS
ncbi:MAG TPA: site-2 protease family protein [Steroidobacteraceae bacterium]|nr:site-2 protease family protein [Steroidobacteraceae bacterium]